MSFPGMAQAEALRKIAADDFFGAVEVCQCPDDASRQACREILSQSHLRVCYGAQPRLLGPKLNPNSLDEAEREQAERTLIEAVDEAEYLGAGESPSSPAAGSRRPKSNPTASYSKPPAPSVPTPGQRACLWSWRSLTTTWTRPL